MILESPGELKWIKVHKTLKKGQQFPRPPVPLSTLHLLPIPLSSVPSHAQF